MIGGLCEIYRHAESNMQRIQYKESDIKTNKSNKDLKTQITDESPLTFDERKKSAEIRFAALIAEKNIFYQTAKEILSLFQNIGKDPDVLNSMMMNRTKCANIITNVLHPVETEKIVTDIQNTKFSVYIDKIRYQISPRVSLSQSI